MYAVSTELQVELAVALWLWSTSNGLKYVPW